MTEMVEVPGVFGITNHIGDAVMRALVGVGELPADFQFRLLGVDPEAREKVATADVLHALDYGSGSGHSYLKGALPNCVFIPGLDPIRPLLQKISGDYHMLHDFKEVTERVGAEVHEAQQSWALYTRHFNPGLYQQLISNRVGDGRRADDGLSRKKVYGLALSRIVIKDAALLSIYRGDVHAHGHGPERNRLLHYLLADNHPELGPDPA